MRFISTRGDAPILGFKDAVLAGLARDGGLYVPEFWPQLGEDAIASMAGKSYSQVAFDVLAPFVDGEIDQSAFREMIDTAYRSFSHQAVAPLVHQGGRYRQRPTHARVDPMVNARGDNGPPKGCCRVYSIHVSDRGVAEAIGRTVAAL